MADLPHISISDLFQGSSVSEAGRDQLASLVGGRGGQCDVSNVYLGRLADGSFGFQGDRVVFNLGLQVLWKG